MSYLFFLIFKYLFKSNYYNIGSEEEKTHY